MKTFRKNTAAGITLGLFAGVFSCVLTSAFFSAFANAAQPHAGHVHVGNGHAGSGHTGSGHTGHQHAAHTPAHVHKHEHKISVQECWIRQLPGNLPSAAYFRLTNAGSKTADLTAVKTDAYARVILHTTTTAQGMIHMHHVAHVNIPAGGHVDFSPGGHHVMLEKPTRKLEVGQILPMTFVLTQGEPVQADCLVRAANAAQPQHGRDHDHHYHQH